MVDLLDEAREEMREEKMRRMLRQFAKPVLILLITLFAGGLLKVWYDSYQSNIIQKEGALYFEGVMSMRAQDYDKSLEKFSQVAKGKSSYAALSALQKASLLNARGRYAEAEETYRAIANNTHYAQDIKDFAGYMALYVKSLHSDDKESLIPEVDKYLAGHPTFACSAIELKAMLFYAAAKNQDAVRTLMDINSNDCPEDMVSRTKRLQIILSKVSK